MQIYYSVAGSNDLIRMLPGDHFCNYSGRAKLPNENALYLKVSETVLAVALRRYKYSYEGKLFCKDWHASSRTQWREIVSP